MAAVVANAPADVAPAPAAPKEDAIDIVQIDAEGAVVKTLHDCFPAGWMAARTEFGKVRNSDIGLVAKADNNVLQLRVNGVVKMSTAPATAKKAKKRSAAPKKTAEKAEKPKKAKVAKAVAVVVDGEAPAADADAAADAADAADEPEAAAAAPKKLSGYMHYSAQNRDAVKAEVAAANPDATKKEMFALVAKALGVGWKALDADAKKKWGDDAPECAEKAPKAEAGPKKLSGFMYYSGENRAAVKAEVEAANPDATKKELFAMTGKAVGAAWKALDADAQAKWKADAPLIKPKEEKKAPKEKKRKADEGGEAEKKKPTRDSVSDKAALLAAMTSDGWTVEETARANSAHKDRLFVNPAGGKKLRSMLEVARASYPDFVVEGTAEKKEKAPKKAKVAEAAAAGTKSIDEYYLGATVSGAPAAKKTDAAEPENPFLSAASE